MLRAAARFAVRRAGAAGTASSLAPVAVGIRNVGLKTLAPTAPTAVSASKPTMAAAAADSASVPVPAGKISQIIGAVVDVQFGTYFRRACIDPRATRAFGLCLFGLVDR